MSHIVDKTLADLEFDTVLNTVSEFCISDLGKLKALNIKPFKTRDLAQKSLNEVHEYVSTFENDNRIPSHYFEAINRELQLLGIENSYLEPSSFLKILTICHAISALKKYFKKFKDYYPTLFEVAAALEEHKTITSRIESTITSYGEVEENASLLLTEIRREINKVRGKIGTSFNRVLAQYNSAGYLDDIKESIIDNQRVLAVLAMHRKKVKGSLLGSSKTGSIVYIAPQATLQFARELQNLRYDEHQEIVRILKELTDTIRIYKDDLKIYQEYLVDLDMIGAKAKYAHKIEGKLPKINEEKVVNLKEAYHPILLWNNRAKNIETVPQSVQLHEQQQIIVISGPNAGGKSITLKTIGLLQVMVQSGLLIPVHERSSTYFFDKILTDIGDNQSIENQLSTYSYRLKNMRNFLRRCNSETLFLIDEFGTGSDPELGGALAEIFLEEFYHKKAFGIITTHYANLKVLASELPKVANANMQFDEKTLEPLFKLYIGQAGSSFTFEVAQKNGIPFNLINKAKKRVESEKVRLDRTISNLQKERQKLQKTSETLEKEKSKAMETSESLTEKEQRIQEKLEGFQQLYDSNQKNLNYGRKLNELLNRYFQSNNKKQFLSDFNKWVASEKTKYLKKHPPKPITKTEKKVQKQSEQKKVEKLQEIEKEVQTEVKKVRELKKEQEKKMAKAKADYIFKVNDRVRIADSRTTGTIDKIEKNKAFVNFGFFTTETKLDKLELVEKGK